jgi:hypothetical protein
LWFKVTLEKKLARLHLKQEAGCGDVCLTSQLHVRSRKKITVPGQNTPPYWKSELKAKGLEEWLKWLGYLSSVIELQG